MTLLAPDGQPIETKADFQTRVLSTATVMYKAAEDSLPDMTVDEFVTACLFMFTNAMCEDGNSVSFATSRARLGIKRMWPGIAAAVKQQQEAEKNANG